MTGFKPAARFGDTESVNQKLKDLWNENGRLSKVNYELKAKLRNMTNEKFKLERIVSEAGLAEENH